MLSEGEDRLGAGVRLGELAIEVDAAVWPVGVEGTDFRPLASPFAN